MLDPALLRQHPADQMRDASLLELFSLEADAQTQVLSAGLLALERNPTQEIGRAHV